MAAGSGQAGRLRTPRIVDVAANAATYVSPFRPHANFASARVLRVGPGRVRTYLRFQVPALDPTLAVAQLRVWIDNRSSGFEVAAARGNWRGRTLTYRRAPPPRGRTIASGPITRAGWQTVDVTALVRRGATTLVLAATAGKATSITGRKSAAHAPTLRLRAGGAQPTFPVRAAFFYDWYPEAWRQQGLDPFSHYIPSRGFYDSGNRSVIIGQIAALHYAHLDAALVSWWGRGSQSDVRLRTLLSATPPDFHWSIYDEQEGQGDPSSGAIRRDLLYLRARAASSPAYLRIGGRFVVFVYAQPSDGCGMARRWMAADDVGAYIVLKVFPGYRGCRPQPDGWHQYAPAKAEDDQAPYSFSISPGFFKATEAAPRLPRDPSAWGAAVKDMVASRARFQLVTTFNEWGEGTAVESARQWQTASGYGAYLDALHNLLPARKP